MAKKITVLKGKTVMEWYMSFKSFTMSPQKFHKKKTFRKYRLMVQKNFKENLKEKQEPHKV